MATGNRTKKQQEAQFKPGQSGNPRGRPAGPGLTQMLIEALKDKTENGKTYAQLLALRVVQKAVSEGDPRMIEFIWDRVEGPLTQSFEHTGKMTLEQAVLASYSKPPDKS